VDRQANLLQVVRALRAPGALAGGLHGGQQHGDQQADDGNHYQEFNERETTPSMGADALHRRTSPRPDPGRKKKEHQTAVLPCDSECGQPGGVFVLVRASATVAFISEVRERFNVILEN
jgi:hypothetical protein